MEKLDKKKLLEALRKRLEEAIVMDKRAEISHWIVSILEGDFDA